MAQRDPAVWENLRRNISQIGQFAIQKKLQEEQRQQELQDLIKKTILASQLKNMRLKEGGDVNKVISPEGSLDLSQFERYNPLEALLGGGGMKTETTAIPGLGQKPGFKLKGITTDEEGNLKYNIEPIETEEEVQQKIQRKALEQAVTGAEKEKQLNISKVSRLGNIADVIEKKFLETSPYTGRITKTGLTPLLGMIDVAKSNLQATSAQINDMAYRKFVKGMRAQLARAMGDVGNLSEPEQKAAMELVPTLLDSKETGLKKLNNLRDFISQLKKTQFMQPTFAGQSMQSQQQYQIGQVIIKGRKQYQITGFDSDGEPLVDLVR